MPATAEKTATYPSPFGVEINTKRNGDVILQCIPGQRMRGAIRPNKGVYNPKTKREEIPVDQAIDMAGFPHVPGQQIHVNPEKGAYTITDPLCDDDALCEEIKNFLQKKRGVRTSDKLSGVPTIPGKLDPHSMKSLCRELWQFVDSGNADFIMGPPLTMDVIDDMPGRYLLQPGLRTFTQMPRYEDDWDAYLDKLRGAVG